MDILRELARMRWPAPLAPTRLLVGAFRLGVRRAVGRLPGLVPMRGLAPMTPDQLQVGTQRTHRLRFVWAPFADALGAQLRHVCMLANLQDMGCAYRDEFYILCRVS